MSHFNYFLFKLSFKFRYHFFLQLRKDILDGKFLVPPASAVLLASYSAQCKNRLWQVYFNMCFNSSLGFWHIIMFQIITPFLQFIYFLSLFQLNSVTSTLTNINQVIYQSFDYFQIKLQKLKRKLVRFISSISKCQTIIQALSLRG